MMDSTEFHQLGLSIAYPNKLLSPLQKAATESIYTRELAERFRAFCCALHDAGYHTLYVGKSPYWRSPSTAMLVTVPSKSSYLGPRLWEVCGKHFRTVCGNGLMDADQTQLALPLPTSYAGSYDLCDLKYQKKNCNKDTST